jgi:hypothetical protein
MSTRLAAAAVALFSCANAVAALPGAPGTERPPASPLTDYFALRLIYFQPALTTEGRYDSDAGTPGTEFSAEDDFGLDDEANQGRMELTFRMRERHLLRADYFKLNRYGESVLTRQINFGNQVFRPGDRVATSLDWRMLGFNYSWVALRRENWELGVGAGLHLTEADARSEVRARNIRESGSGTAILPTLGVDGTWRINRRWSAGGFVRYISVSNSDADGSFGDYHFDVQYRWKPNVAVGLGWSSISLDAEVFDADLPGKLKIEASGPELFLRASF